MKKNLLLLLATLCGLATTAQDIIITKDAKRIEAKIQEVSDKEIKYKKFAYQEGPDFILSTTEINSILFENGDTQVFSNTAAQQPPQAPAQPAPPAQYYKYHDFYTPLNYIVKNGDTYFLHNGTNITEMDKSAYLLFLQKNCPDAWYSYQKGNRLWKAGWGLFGAGLGTAFLIGLPLLCVGINGEIACYDHSHNYYADNYCSAGKALMITGSLMAEGSIPLLIVGSIKRNNSHEVYNERCLSRTPVTLSLQSSASGIGLALNF